MRQMVMGLLKPYQDRSLQDQEQFKKIHENEVCFEDQIQKLNKTVFTNGEGVQIFDIIKGELK